MPRTEGYRTPWSRRGGRSCWMVHGVPFRRARLRTSVESRCCLTRAIQHLGPPTEIYEVVVVVVPTVVLVGLCGDHSEKNCTDRCLRRSGSLGRCIRAPGPITCQPGWGWRSEGRAMNPSRRTASQANDDLNIDTRTMYSSDCTVVLSQANTPPHLQL
jgi:hypothetical protein